MNLCSIFGHDASLNIFSYLESIDIGQCRALNKECLQVVEDIYYNSLFECDAIPKTELKNLLFNKCTLGSEKQIYPLVRTILEKKPSQNLVFRCWFNYDHYFIATQGITELKFKPAVQLSLKYSETMPEIYDFLFRKSFAPSCCQNMQFEIPENRLCLYKLEYFYDTENLPLKYPEDFFQKYRAIWESTFDYALMKDVPGLNGVKLTGQYIEDRLPLHYKEFYHQYRDLLEQKSEIYNEFIHFLEHSQLENKPICIYKNIFQLSMNYCKTLLVAGIIGSIILTGVCLQKK